MKSSDGSNRPLIRRPTRTLLVVVPLLAIAGVIASGAVHEGGHAIVARLAGLEVVNTQPWVLLGPPHVQVRGETTNAWRAAMNSAGMLASVGTGLAGTGTLLWAARWRPRCLLGTWFFAPMIC